MDKYFNESMYEWLDSSISRYYQFVRTIKQEDLKSILLYKNKKIGRYIVVKKLQGVYAAYSEMKKMKNPYVALVFEVVDDGMKTLVVEEYVDGMALADILQQQVYSMNSTCRIGMQVCEGLYALHKSQIIHRDIKPENIMMLPDGEIKIIDFDSARIHSSYAKKDTKVLGTIGYAAPEQYGEAQSDERTDIYALGILLNVMVTRKHPVNEIANGKLGAIIEKCIMVNPDRRYKNVLEIREELKNVIY